MWCKRNVCRGQLALGYADVTTGITEWTNVASLTELQSRIADMLSPEKRAGHFDFCLIGCRSNSDKTGQNNSTVAQQQLLLLPPHLRPPDGRRPHRQNHNININIIHIDSVSRQHFYRSLPETIIALGKLAHTKSSATTVLDFRLFQSLKARTYETLNTLFAGIRPRETITKEGFTPFDLDAPPVEPIGFDVLLEPLRVLGYKTLYLEDMCWKWQWGLAKNLAVHAGNLTLIEKWSRLQRALKRARIDDIGISLSSCDILDRYGLRDPFHGPGAICFNGRFQHEYLLEYLRQFQVAADLVGQPYFSFLMTNVGHEDSGRRIQTLDGALAGYVASLGNLRNTITFIMSDHGNTYGDFVEKTMDGRLEMFHPALFVVIPDRFQSILSSKALMNLATNQDRLITVHDVHLTLQHLLLESKRTLLKPTSKGTRPTPPKRKQKNRKIKKEDLLTQGLLSPISANRTCQDISANFVAVCLCSGHAVRVKGRQDHLLLAGHAVAVLNEAVDMARVRSPNALQRQLVQGGCLRLTVHHIDNIFERQEVSDTDNY